VFNNIDSVDLSKLMNTLEKIEKQGGAVQSSDQFERAVGVD